MPVQQIPQCAIAFGLQMASAFKMAWPYGAVRIMSGYRWPDGRLGNDGEGPPRNGDDIKVGVCLNNLF